MPDLDFQLLEPAKKGALLTAKKLEGIFTLKPGQKLVLLNVGGAAVLFPLDPARSILARADEVAAAIATATGTQPASPASAPGEGLQLAAGEDDVISTE